MMKVSVVIPAYNEEATLGDCLESLANQSVKADEIIVVDNNSTDKTRQIAENFGARVISQPVQGIMPATYAGMMASSGDIIARCDADCIVPLDWIVRIKREFSCRPDMAALTGPGDFYHIDRYQVVLARVFYMQAYFLLVGSALAHWPLFGSNLAIRRSVWLSIHDKLHWQRTDIHDDMEISIHLPVSAGVAYIPDLVVGMSPRSLGLSGMKPRLTRGFRSLTLHWPEQSPWRRWRDKIFQN